jgi:hypothetical protein
VTDKELTSEGDSSDACGCVILWKMVIRNTVSVILVMQVQLQLHSKAPAPILKWTLTLHFEHLEEFSSPIRSDHNLPVGGDEKGYFSILYLRILLHYFTYNNTTSVTMQLTKLICIFSFLFSQHVSALAGHHQVLLFMLKLLKCTECHFYFGVIIYQIML